MRYIYSRYSSGNMRRENSAGFTLVELLVVIGIIALLVALLLPAVRTAPEATRRMQCQNNLKLIGLALHNYHDSYGSLPPAFLADESGRPMHSWRVLILPFMEHQNMYENYRFDEPWNGPNNRKLMKDMPDVYRCPGYEHHPHEHDDPDVGEFVTNYQVVVGTQTAFPGRECVSFDDITDGTANTIFVLEVGGRHAVPWTAPRDISAEDLKAMFPEDIEENENHLGGFQVLRGDGSLAFIQHSVEQTTFDALLTIAGNEELGPY